MEGNKVSLFRSFEAGKMGRRQLLQALGVTASVAFAGSAAPKESATLSTVVPASVRWINAAGRSRIPWRKPRR